MSYSKIQTSVETLYKRKVFTFIGHHMKIRNVAFIAALIGWIALAVYYVTPSESAVAKEIETAPKTVGETFSTQTWKLMRTNIIYFFNRSDYNSQKMVQGASKCTKRQLLWTECIALCVSLRLSLWS